MTNGAVKSRRRPPDWFEILLGLALGIGLLASIGIALMLLFGSVWASVWFVQDVIRRLGG